MAQRGRKSAAESEIPRIGGERPRPPEDLTEFEKGLWTRIADCKPPDWFTKDTHEILYAYCKHATYARLLDERIRACEDSAELIKLLHARGNESGKMLAAARSMRITQQAMYDAAAASRKTKPRYKPSWEE